MRAHFIGIGGIGVSALAQYYLAKSHKVSGSDLVSSEITEFLKKKGVSLAAPGAARLGGTWCCQPDLVVYSPAVPQQNIDLKKARKLGIKCLSYPEALGELTKQHFTIAVSGTHGKSTTTSMIGLLLTKAGLDPTVIVGTKIEEFGNTNCRVGKSKYLVIEADEHFASFLNYYPKIIVLTNIEKDHLDFYKNLRNILKTFKEYIGHLSKTGVLVANGDDKNIQAIISNCHFPITRFHFSESGDVQKLKGTLGVPGKHNLYNAQAALAVARILKVPDETSFKALSEYHGSWRRFELKEMQISGFKLPVISDYAHHPTEIQATIAAVSEKWPQKKIWAIFQPHQYQRTFYLFDDFCRAFDGADQIILSDVYDVAGREEGEISKKVSSKSLAEAIGGRGKTVYYIADFRKIPQFLKSRIDSNSIILIMGAGDIYKMISDF